MDQTQIIQSLKAAYLFLGGAEKAIDMKRGEGYAAAHPELVAAFMLTTALDFHAQQHAATLEGIKLSLDDLLGERQGA